MKTLFKCISVGLLAVTMAISFSSRAWADTATSWVAGPQLKLEKWISGSTYPLTPGGAGYPQGNKTYTFFAGYGELPQSFARDNARIMEVFLMEDDTWILPDDLVKCYTGKFTGWKLTSMQLSCTITPGTIDYDKTAEMYIKCNVRKTTNPNMSDPSTGTIIGKMFNYQIGINSN